MAANRRKIAAMSPPRISFNLPPQLLGRLRTAQDKTGLSLADLVRRALDLLLKELGV